MSLKLVDWLRSIIKGERGLVYVSVGNTGSAALGAIFWFILAALLQVEEYGLTNYYIATAGMAAGIAVLGLTTTVTTYLAKGEEMLLRQANAITVISSAGALLITLVYASWFVAVMAVASIFLSMSVAELLGRRNYKEYVLVALGSKGTQIALSLALFFTMGIMGIIVGYAIGAFVFSYRYFFSLRDLKFAFDKIKEKMKFTVNSFGLNTISVLIGTLDKIAVGTWFGMYTLGLYQLSFQFLMVLALLPIILYMYLLPENASGVARKGVRIAGIASSVLLVIIMFTLSSSILNWLFPKFIAAEDTIKIMSIAIIPTTIATICNAKLLGEEKSTAVVIGSGISLAIIMAGIYLLGSAFGLTGIATTIIIAATVQAAYLLTRTKNIL